jgi:hypothetical protein
MKYPMAGDLQSELGVQVNPTENPWEVRSDTGLEGVFAERDDAEFYADEIKGGGARRVTVSHRVRLSPPRPPGAPPMFHAPQGRPPGVPNPSSFSEKGERMYEHIKQQYEAKGDPRAKEIAARTVYASSSAGVPGLIGRRNPSQFTAKGQRVFKRLQEKLIAEGSDPVDAAMNAELAMAQLAEQGEGDLMTAEGSREAREFFGEGPETNPSHRQFREGVRVIFAPTPASMMLYSDPPAIGATGVVTSVPLGGGRRASFLAGPGGGLVYVDWDLYPVQGVSPNDLEINQILERAKRAASGRTDTTRLSKRRGNPDTIVRERWTDGTTIVIERGAHGYTGWLESKDGRRLPISFGREPSNAQDALALAEKFLRGVHGKNNPKPETTPEILIAWYAVPNENKAKGGFMPVFENNGKLHGNTHGRGYDKDEAEKMAKAMAQDEAAHYSGDWNVVVVQKGESQEKNPEDDTFDTDILGGMERAIWVTSYADWVEEMSKDERKERGDVPVSLQGIEWSDAAPPAPASALLAAEDLYLSYKRANGKTPGELFEIAARADGVRPTDELADEFGHYLAMMAMGHGVSWFDDHKEFKIKQPNFEAHHDDGEVWWSPQIKSRQNGGRT